MDIFDFFPVWNKLTAEQQRFLTDCASLRKIEKGTIIHSSTVKSTGILVVGSGQLRAYMISDEGREITLYRLFERDMCLFSAACIMRSVQFEITIEVEKDALIWVIPSEAYKKLMERSIAVSNYTNEVMATRFSDVIWLVEQILWKSFDKRLAAFLMEESKVEGSSVLKITHEMIGNHMGNPREVVTRMLRYFQGNGLIRLSRGTIDIIEYEKLKQLSE